MIKKILFIAVLVFYLCGCAEQRISEILFIASIGFEKNEESGYKGYFYLPVSEDIGNPKEPSSNGSGEFMVIEGKDVIDIFYKSQTSTELQMNLRHISSIVLNDDLLNGDFLNEFIEYVKHSDYIDFNFYVFITKDKLEDIFSFQNPNKESVLNSILVSTYDSPSIFLAQEPVHFLEFCRDFYLNKSIKLPLLVIEKIWNIEDEKVKSYKCRDAVIYYSNNKVNIIDNDCIVYMKNNKEFYDEIDDEPIYFRDYKIEIIYKDTPIIKIRSKYTPLITFSNPDSVQINKKIEENVSRYINDYLAFDPLNLNYFNLIKDTNYSYENIKYEIKTELY